MNGDVAAYTALKPADPAYLLLQEASQKGLFFDACFDSAIAKKFSEEGKCANCSARGELEGLVKLYSVGPLHSP